MKHPALHRVAPCLLPILAAALLGCNREERLPKPPPTTPRPVTSFLSPAAHCPPACAVAPVADRQPT